MKSFVCALTLLAVGAAGALGQNQIPAAAWRIPIGTPVANPGGHNPKSAARNIDDGYWQGAPVGGLGAGTFSRSYRGRFERWHVKAGTHKYEDVPANQFAVFAQPEGEAPVSMALSVGQPQNGALSSLELELSGRRRRICRALSKSLVRLWDQGPACQAHGGAVFAPAAE